MIFFILQKHVVFPNQLGMAGSRRDTLLEISLHSYLLMAALYFDIFIMQMAASDFVN